MHESASHVAGHDEPLGMDRDWAHGLEAMRTADSPINLLGPWLDPTRILASATAIGDLARHPNLYERLSSGVLRAQAVDRLSVNAESDEGHEFPTFDQLRSQETGKLTGAVDEVFDKWELLDDPMSEQVGLVF